MSQKIFNMLQLFAEGAGGANSGGTSANAADAGQSDSGITDQTGAALGAPADGLQAEGAEVSLTGTDDEATPDEKTRRREYRDFIKKNKDLHSEEMQKVINKRFRETKQQSELVSKQGEILDFLHARYGTKDIDELRARVESDDALLSTLDEFGDASGESPEMKRLRIENMRLNRRLTESAEAERVRRYNERIAGEEAAFREKTGIKEFSVAEEISSNRDFARLLASGLSVEQAYNAIHHDELISSALRFAQKDAMQKAADNVRSRQSRPRENGAGAQSAVNLEKDVSALTKREREEYAKRALRGETIKF